MFKNLFKKKTITVKEKIDVARVHFRLIMNDDNSYQGHLDGVAGLTGHARFTYLLQNLHLPGTIECDGNVYVRNENVKHIIKEKTDPLLIEVLVEREV